MTSQHDLVPRDPAGVINSPDLPVEKTSDPIPIRFVWGLLRRHRVLLLGSAVAGGALAAWVTRDAIPTYEAWASIRIDPRPSELPVLDVLRMTAGNEVNTEMEMLRSRSLSKVVADSLALQLQVTSPQGVPRSELFADVRIGQEEGGVQTGRYFLERAPSGLNLRDRVSRALITNVEPGSQVHLGSLSFRVKPQAMAAAPIDLQIQSVEEATDRVQAALKVSRRNREANLIEVRFKGTDPYLVRDVANALAARFTSQRLAERQAATRTTAEFLRGQLSKLSRQLRSAEDSLQRFRETARAVDLAVEAGTGVTHAADIQAQRNVIEAERSALGKLVDQATATAAGTPRGHVSPYRSLLAFPTLLKNQAAASLLSAISAADERRSDLLSRRTPRDPDVQLLDRRVAELEEQLRVIAVTYLQGLSNQVEALDSTLVRSGKQLARIPAKEIRQARLQREVKGLEEIVLQLQSRLKESEVAEVANDPTVRVVDTASVPRAPLGSRRTLIIAFACCLGLTLGLGGAFIKEYWDDSIRTQMDVQAATGLPILGWIPRINASRASLRSSKRVARQLAARGSSPAANGRSFGHTTARPTVTGNATLLLKRGQSPTPFSDAYDQLHTNVVFARRDHEPRVLLVTSALPGEGKTTTAINLAITLAQRSLRVLLIDGDLRRGVVARMFRAPREPGLAEVLAGTVKFEEALHRIEVGEGNCLDFLTSGKFPSNPAHLLEAHAHQLLERAQESYDRIILDSSPLNIVADAAILGRQAEGVLLVTRLGVTPFGALVRSAEQFRNAGVSVLGAVLNDIRFDRDASYDEGLRWYEYAKSYYARPEPE